MTNITTERVRYAETDAMGITHHGTYLLWMEMGRTNLLRESGLAYSELESLGVMLPVTKLGCKYIDSSKYDDVISIHTTNTVFKGVRLRVDYKIYKGEDDERKLIFLGYTEHAVIDTTTRRPKRPPEFMKQHMILPDNPEEFKNDI